MRALMGTKKYVLGEHITLLNGQVMRIDGIFKKDGITFYQLVPVNQDPVILPKVA